MNEIQAGDCIVALRDSSSSAHYLEGYVYKVKFITGRLVDVEIDSDGKVACNWFTSSFKKATEAETMCYDYYKFPFDSAKANYMEDYLRAKIVESLKQELNINV